MRTLRMCGVIGVVAVLTFVAAPAALAAPLDRHHGLGPQEWQRGFPGAPVLAPGPVVPVAQPLPVPVPVAVPVPAVQAAILPPLQQAFPTAGFAQSPPQLVALPGNGYALSHPLLFCGPDAAGSCQAMAWQLAQVAPGFGTAVMNGPEGYGVYLTYGA